MNAPTNFYDLLGLDRNCSLADIRLAFRMLVKQHHPDVNQAPADTSEAIRAINEAYRVLKDPESRAAYDATFERAATSRQGRVEVSIKHDLYISITDLLCGASLDVQVRDPANRNGVETYPLEVLPGTAPGHRFKLKRHPPFEAGSVMIRLKIRPDARFKPRGADLRCDLRIPARRAEQGGREMVRGPEGTMLTVTIPAHAARGEVVRLPGEGLPKPRGGRGDLLVRIMYRPEVRVMRGGATSEKSAFRRGLLRGG